MLRPVRGVLAVEGIQTGDGRLFRPGALTWDDGPLPFAWLAEGDQHIDVVLAAPTIGTIDTISRFGEQILFTGTIDDAIAEGREFVRRMEEGTGSLGSRFSVSIDIDNYALELVLNDGDDFDLIILASGEGQVPDRRTLLASALAPITAAAGEGDVTGEVLFSDAADSLLLRFTRGRIRGAVGLAIGAFAEAYVELAPRAVVTAGATVAVGDETWHTLTAGCIRPSSAVTATWTITPDVVTAAAVPLVRGLVGPDRPAAELFAPVTTEPDGSLNIDGEHVSGYIATFETCHTGYTDRCVLAPREPDYGLFHHGAVELESGERQPVGVFTWGIPHADLTLAMLAAMQHYANARHGFAHVVVGANEWGIWHSGVLRPGITKDDVRDLQALSMSGDWRFRPGEGLRLIASLAVNYPGFPVPRRAAMAAGAGMMTAGPAVHFGDDGQVLALVAAGMVAPAEPHGHGDCGCDGAVLRAQIEDLSPLVLAALDRQVGSWRKDGPVVHMPRLSRAGRVPVLPR